MAICYTMGFMSLSSSSSWKDPWIGKLTDVYVKKSHRLWHVTEHFTNVVDNSTTCDITQRQIWRHKRTAVSVRDNVILGTTRQIYVNKDTSPHCFDASIKTDEQSFGVCCFVIGSLPIIILLLMFLMMAIQSCIETMKWNYEYGHPNDARQPVSDIECADVSSSAIEDALPDTVCPAPTPANDLTATQCCCVCLSEPKCVVFMPCMHVCTCMQCGLAGRLTHCPLCSRGITARHNLFL